MTQQIQQTLAFASFSLKNQEVFYPDYDVQWSRRSGYYSITLDGKELARFPDMAQCDPFIKQHAQDARFDDQQDNIFDWSTGQRRGS